MKHWFALTAFIILLALVALYKSANDKKIAEPSMGVSEFLGDTNAEGFKRVFEPRSFRFPADHGPHPEYKNEWWYFTGNLVDESGRRFGYELTFFRFALKPGNSQRESNWSTHQAYMAHFAITDAESKEFHVWERFSRSGADLAGATAQPFHVWLDNWSINGESKNNNSCRGCLSMQLEATQNDFAIDLTLDSKKPVVLQGDNGLSQKNETPGNASYYYSLTRLVTSGELVVDGKRFKVTGNSWLDREWSTSALDRTQSGWDWFALQLSDEREIMFYWLRREDGSDDPFNQGVIVAANGDIETLKAKDVVIEELDFWRSKQSGIRYPSKWRFTIPGKAVDLTISPLMNDQELNLAFRYWEGACKVTGTIGNTEVKGYAYVELTGYNQPN